MNRKPAVARSACVLLLLALLACGARGAAPPAAARDALGDPLPPHALARMGTPRLHHRSFLSSVVFSPNGKVLATCGSGMICLWDPATGRLLRRLERQFVNSLCFSPDGKRLAVVGGGTGTVRFWDAATGKSLGQVGYHDWGSDSVAYSPDGKRVASGCHDGSVFVWDVATGKAHPSPEKQKGAVRGLAFSPDGKYLVCAGGESPVRLWDTATGKAVRTLSTTGYYSSFSFTGDGKRVAGWGGVFKPRQKERVRVWEVSTGKELLALAATGDTVTNLSYSSDGKHLACAGDKGEVYLWDGVTGALRFRLRGHLYHVGAVSFSPDGTLASAGGTRVFLWNAATGKEAVPLAGHVEGITALALTPDGRTVVTGGDDGFVRSWRFADGRPVRQVRAVPEGICSLAIHPDGRTLAAGGWGEQIVTHDLATGKKRGERKSPHGTGVMGLSYMPDGKLLASTGYDSVVRLWDRSAGKEVRQVKGSGGPLMRLARSNDGKYLATSGSDFNISVFDMAAGKLLWHDKERRYVYSVAFSTDGRTVASVGTEKWVQLWDVLSGRAIDRFPQEPADERFYSVAFLDAHTAAAGDAAGVVRLCELASGRERARFVGHEGEVSCLLPARRGRVLLSASRDSTALVWDVTGQSSGRPALTGERLAALWDDLAGADAVKAHRAVWALALSPGHSLPLLGTRLRPVRLDERRLDRLVADLGGDAAPREKAAGELESLGGAVEAYLREVSTTAGSVEVRARAKEVLGRLKERPTSGERLRAVRAVEVLEHVGSPEARRLLRGLAGGEPRATATRAAKAALGRLEGGRE